MLVSLDSNVLIAMLSPQEAHSQTAQKLAKQISNGEHAALVSSLAYGEVLSFKNARLNEFFSVRFFFNSLNYLSSTPADDNICLLAGELRLKWGARLKLPDALHLATALNQQADLFVTNDLVLAKIAKQITPTKTLAEWSKK